MSIKLSHRVATLKPYVFSSLDEKKADLAARGVQVIDLGIGDPDIPTCNTVIKALKRECMNPKTHRYPSYQGRLDFREAVADYYSARFGVQLDPVTQVMSLIGSKEGLFHAPLAFVDPGDIVLVPDPCYPIYETAALFAGGQVHFMPLLEENAFLPDLDAIPEDVRRRARVMFLNYPNNPTAAIAPPEFLDQVIAFCKEWEILLLYDNAYSEIYSGNKRNAPISPLSRPGGMDVCLEMGSLSKPFSMTGWRVGYALGNAQAVHGLLQVKKNVDSGVFEAIQLSAIRALQDCQEEMRHNNDLYAGRKEEFASIIAEAGWEIPVSDASFYLWARCPEGNDDIAWCERLISEANVVCAPGSGFGEHGRGYLRFAMTVPLELVQKAAGKIASMLNR